MTFIDYGASLVLYAVFVFNNYCDFKQVNDYPIHDPQILNGQALYCGTLKPVTVQRSLTRAQ